MAVELEVQDRREQRQHGGVQNLDDATDELALLAVDDVESAIHHQEVLGVGRDEDRDRRQNGADRDHDEQREDVLDAPQRLVAVVERPAHPELDVTLVGIGDLFAGAAARLPEPGDPEHRQDQPGGDRQTHEDVTALQGSHLEDVVDDNADESSHRDRDGDAREAWPGVVSMVRTHPQLVTLAEPVQPGLEWRESGSDDDPLGEGWQHELAAAFVDDPDLPRCAVVHQVAHAAIRLDVERVVVALTGRHRALSLRQPCSSCDS